ncbi:MAG: tRNA(Ile)(2)-agmatinylcytidine synthase [Halobacteria archaeon]|nr:tRNA(Ile)(2)-agmatinylcytidine synthase [Halobacteria archaeon]
MCTTYLATLIAESVSEVGVVKDSLLVRLNPNIPYKTRGNACLALHIETDGPEQVKEVKSKTIDLIEENAVFEDDKTNPGVAFLEDNEPPQDLSNFTLEAVRSVKEIDEAKELANSLGIETHGWKMGRGVIGAIAAVGASGAFDDWTYELIAYRGREEWGEKRGVDYDSFFEADTATYPSTWDTVDYSTGSVVAVPNTNGPVIYGLRGTLKGVWKANSYVSVDTPVKHVRVFRTNQGTDYHLINAEIGEVEDYRSYRLTGRVGEPPETIEGGHVFFTLRDGENSIKCAAFEPTKAFRKLIRDLREGDRITVCGGVKNGTLNVEKMNVHELNDTELVNPVCDGCGKRMKSAGKDQGYRCRDCGTTAQEKVEERVERFLEEGWYEVPPSARRHIAKPLVRGNFEKPHFWLR